MRLRLITNVARAGEVVVVSGLYGLERWARCLGRVSAWGVAVWVARLKLITAERYLGTHQGFSDPALHREVSSFLCRGQQARGKNSIR